MRSLILLDLNLESVLGRALSCHVNLSVLLGLGRRQTRPTTALAIPKNTDGTLQGGLEFSPWLGAAVLREAHGEGRRPATARHVVSNDFQHSLCEEHIMRNIRPILQSWPSVPKIDDELKLLKFNRG